MSEHSQPPARLKTPEKAPSYTPLLGLQGRLVMGGDALIASKPVTLSKESLAIDTSETTLTLIHQASLRERTAETKDVQLVTWKKAVVSKITQIPESPLGKEHVEFFEKMGIDIKNFNDKNAQDLYDRYFSKEHEGKEIEQFIAHIAQAFTVGTGANAHTDIPAVTRHLAAVQWMAGMFGKNSSELVTQMLEAQIESTNQDLFIAQRKDKVNALSTHEKDLLLFLKGHDAIPIDAHKTKKGSTPPVGDEPKFTITKKDFKLKSSTDLKTNNLQASIQFIDVLRDNLSIADSEGYRTNQFNMKIKEGNNYFGVGSFVIGMKERYHLPINIMVKGAHAHLVTNGPHKQANNKWYVSIWNPFNAGTEEVELHGDYSDPTKAADNFSREQTLGPNNFIMNADWFNEYKRDPKSTNLEALIDQPEFAGMREELMSAKFQELQKDAQNCVPLCGYLSALLNRLSDDSPFVTTGGIDRFEKDFGFHIKTKGEIVARGSENKKRSEIDTQIKHAADYLAKLDSEAARISIDEATGKIAVPLPPASPAAEPQFTEYNTQFEDLQRRFDSRNKKCITELVLIEGVLDVQPYMGAIIVTYDSSKKTPSGLSYIDFDDKNNKSRGGYAKTSNANLGIIIVDLNPDKRKDKVTPTTSGIHELRHHANAMTDYLIANTLPMASGYRFGRNEALFGNQNIQMSNDLFERDLPLYEEVLGRRVSNKDISDIRDQLDYLDELHSSFMQKKPNWFIPSENVYAHGTHSRKHWELVGSNSEDIEASKHLFNYIQGPEYMSRMRESILSTPRTNAISSEETQFIIQFDKLYQQAGSYIGTGRSVRQVERMVEEVWKELRTTYPHVVNSHKKSFEDAEGKNQSLPGATQFLFG